MLDSLPEVVVKGMTIDRMRLLLAMRGLETNTLPGHVCSIDNIKWLHANGFTNGLAYNGFHSVMTAKGDRFVADLQRFAKDWGRA